MFIDTIRVCGYETPLGYDLSDLSVSWKVRDVVGKSARNVLLQVASDDAMQVILLEKQGAGLNSLGEPLELALTPCTRYYVRVTVETDAGEKAEAVSWFETGKMGDAWAASWIGTPENDKAPEFRKTFSLEQPAEHIATARLYVSGLGVFDAAVNGEKAGDDFLAPFITDYKDHVQYCTYDVKDLLQEDNDVRIFLGNGWYKGRFGLSCAEHPDYPFAAIAELHVAYEDGTEQVVCTDDRWETRPSVFVFGSIYDGETQDWTAVSDDWSAAIVLKAPTKLVDRYSPNVGVRETLSVKEVIHTPKGETVLDFGQNFAGFVRVTADVPQGTTLKLEFGELLQQGNFYHDNYRTAKSEFAYVSDGTPRVIEPRFTFFGFRYVKVTGLETVNAEDFTGCAVYSNMDRTGAIATGHAKVDRLFLNSLWGMKSNFLDMPTDCPQRDERLGWCGDALVFSTTAGFHMDTKAFYRKFLRDLRLDQRKNGGRVAIYLPNEFAGMYAGVWSDIATFLPKMVYDYYGDVSLLRESYPLMKDWVDFVDSEDEAQHKDGKHFLYDFGFQFGDWLALDGATEQSCFGRTDNYYVASMYYYASTSYVADAAEVLGYADDMNVYRDRAARIKEAILDEYFTKTGRLAVETQTGYLLALKFGVYKDKQKILDGLNTRFKQDCYRIKGGFVGATCMNCVLAENDMTDTAYDFLFFEGFPGWLHCVDLGATTIWERWNSVLPDGTISGTEMNSMNHYSYGSVVEFLYRYAMGLQPTSPGFRSVRFAPAPDIRLGHLEGSYDSACGRYVSNWAIREDGSLSFHIEVPFGCTAEVCLPEQVPFVVETGVYDYTIRPEKNYRALYSAKTRFEDLVKDERVVAVLNECMPGFVDTLDRTDNEAMTRSLESELVRMTVFRQPNDHIKKAIAGISVIEV